MISIKYASAAPQRSTGDAACAMPGDIVSTEDGALRGHGTRIADDGSLVATVCGVVERVNKLASVRPLNSR